MRKAYDLAYWDAAKIKDAISHANGLKTVKPSSVHMGAMDYIDLRKPARDEIDVNTERWSIEAGFMGSIYGLTVHVKKSSVQGIVSILGPEDVPLSHVVNVRRWSKNAVYSRDHSLLFHAGSFPDCPDGMCVSLSVMNS